MSSYCEEQYINSLEQKNKELEKQLQEKEVMIDWLAMSLFRYSLFFYPEQWKKLAKEAVKYEKAVPSETWKEDWIKQAKNELGIKEEKTLGEKLKEGFKKFREAIEK
ncbi:MAG: hypothetical protein HDQ88_12095 [Clostridia bacterium]|nr:hypothetical protein [Clostridia bacterium]